MTDLVAELRKRADAEGWGSQLRLGTASGLREAAEIIEADPLCKAAPGMARLLESARKHMLNKISEPCSFCEGWHEDVTEILAPLPKEELQ